MVQDRKSKEGKDCLWGGEIIWPCVLGNVDHKIGGVGSKWFADVGEFWGED